METYLGEHRKIKTDSILCHLTPLCKRPPVVPSPSPSSTGRLHPAPRQTPPSRQHPSRMPLEPPLQSPKYVLCFYGFPPPWEEESGQTLRRMRCVSFTSQHLHLSETSCPPSSSWVRSRQIVAAIKSQTSSVAAMHRHCTWLTLGIHEQNHARHEGGVGILSPTR